ncbi:hypothetical protein BDK51DRAFT_37030 [Blyttiomyces helicus]|uniref:Uncharacterized protein n=1 Tax=Blyttiomyces helicus TaxID=388810 RepID=A0A4V1IRN4_9FUNG|nr:hypothetical protein BDK51DRAFT_37030 [Blyttiomyces helicus]|eukprot:RKO90667.1 hypothetical protein BDK51DRAFT_37030 [Blyttiomyces helicus]
MSATEDDDRLSVRLPSTIPMAAHHLCSSLRESLQTSRWAGPSSFSRLRRAATPTTVATFRTGTEHRRGESARRCRWSSSRMNTNLLGGSKVVTAGSRSLLEAMKAKRTRRGRADRWSGPTNGEDNDMGEGYAANERVGRTRRTASGLERAAADMTEMEGSFQCSFYRSEKPRSLASSQETPPEGRVERRTTALAYPGMRY